MGLLGRLLAHVDERTNAEPPVRRAQAGDMKVYQCAHVCKLAGRVRSKAKAQTSPQSPSVLQTDTGVSCTGSWCVCYANKQARACLEAQHGLGGRGAHARALAERGGGSQQRAAPLRRQRWQGLPHACRSQR